MKKVNVYLHTECRYASEGHVAAYGLVMQYGDKAKEFSHACRGSAGSLNLQALVYALSVLNQQCDVHVYTDSNYLVDTVTSGRLKEWSVNNWQMSYGPVENADNWRILVQLFEVHNVKFTWVKGYVATPQTNRCYELALNELSAFLRHESGLPKDF